MKIEKIACICLLILMLCAGTLKSQETIASVEKSLYGIQTGFLGFWVHNESRISPKWALRSELGLEYNYEWGEKFRFRPVFTLEPRWYFNINGRLSQGKRIDANSGNFLSFKMNFRSYIFLVPKDVFYDNTPVHDTSKYSISIIPTIGARKNIGINFNYELGFGLGVAYFNQEGYGFNFFDFRREIDLQKPRFGPAWNIVLRIGYKL